MTVVIGFNWLTEVVVIADSRVSWKDNRYPAQDILRKLYTIDGSNKSAVLGFCGDLEPANVVIRFLIGQKLQNYKRPFVLAQFRDDLSRWIEQIAKQDLRPKQRTKIKFMLCGIEPSRHPPILRDKQLVGQMPFTEAHIYVITISSSGRVDCNKQSKRYAVIGTGQALEQAIAKKLDAVMSFGWNQPNLHWGRAVLGGDVIAHIIKEHDTVSTTVGGPFQVVRITSHGLETHYIWPPEAPDKNVEIEHRGAKTVVRNATTKEEYILYPIWEFPLQVQGASG